MNRRFAETAVGAVVLAIAVWFLAFLGDGVHWSGNQFRVLGNGQMVRRAGGASPPLPTYHPAKR